MTPGNHKWWNKGFGIYVGTSVYWYLSRRSCGRTEKLDFFPGSRQGSFKCPNPIYMHSEYEPHKSACIQQVSSWNKDMAKVKSSTDLQLVLIPLCCSFRHTGAKSSYAGHSQLLKRCFWNCYAFSLQLCTEYAMTGHVWGRADHSAHWQPAHLHK